MLRSQQQSFGAQRYSYQQRRNPLLQRHPVLFPLALIVSALAFSIASFYADSIFPILTLTGASSTLLCLLLAFVLGMCGVLICIISILEIIDRQNAQASLQTQAAYCPRSKEHSYDRH